MWVVDSIGHLGVDGLVDMLQQCVGVATKSIFGNKLSGRSCRKKHYYKPCFDVDCRTTKCELRLWLKANPDLHVTKHQETKLKKLLKNKKNSRKVQELNICVHLPRWIRSRFGKSIDQRHLSWIRSVQLHFWKASVG